MSKVFKYGIIPKPLKEIDDNEKCVVIPDGEPKDDYKTIKTNNVDEADDDGFVEAVSSEIKAEIEAKHLLERAEKEAAAKAKEIIAEAEQQAEFILAKAAEEGRRQGYDQAFEELSSQIKSFLVQSQGVLDRLEEHDDSFVKEYIDRMSGLALEIASEILKQKIEMDPLSLCDMIEAAIPSFRNASWITVKISKELVPLIELLRSELVEKFPSFERITVQETGGAADECVIESDAGAIDISISRQLANLQKRIERADKENR